MEIRAVGGTVKLDFTEAVITEPTLQIEAKVQGGSLVLVTKPGIEVDADDVAVRGGSVRVRPDTGSKRPVILRVRYRARLDAAALWRDRRGGHSGNGYCASQGRRRGWKLLNA